MKTKALVQKILEEPLGHDWSYQGLGMLRLYLSEELRLHVWDPLRAVADVSQLHTHPWSMVSEVVAGVITQRRYVIDKSKRYYPRYMQQKILCGPGGGLCDAPVKTQLHSGPDEVYGEGDVYTQRPDEIHVSFPAAGTVTLVKREFLEDPDHAYVFWPAGQNWVSAEPRPATPREVDYFTRLALLRWFVKD